MGATIKKLLVGGYRKIGYVERMTLNPHPSKTERYSPMRSMAAVLMGKSAQGVIALIYAGLAARTLGVEGFGALALIHGTVYGISQLLRLHNWPTVVRYGALARHDDDLPRLTRLIAFTLRWDMLAAVLSLVLLQVFLPVIARWYGLPPAMLDAFALYALTIVLMVPVPSHYGILRLFGQFRQIGFQATIEPMLRLFGTLYLWFNDGTLTQFLIVWAAATVLSRLCLFWRAWSELRRQCVPLGTCLKGQWRSDEVGIWPFITSGTYVQTLQAMQSTLSLMLVGGLLGPAAAGVFRIAQQLATVLVKPTQKLLAPTIYPEFAQAVAAHDHAALRRTMWRCARLATALSAVLLGVLALAGPTIIHLVGGPGYEAAYAPMLWLAVAGALMVAVFPLEPALSASGHMRPIVGSQSVALMSYVAAMLTLVPSHGLVGAGIASAIAALCQMLLILRAAVRYL